MGWRVVPVALAIVLVTACGRGYEGENRSIVSELPQLAGTELVAEDYIGSCSTESCPFGNDLSRAVLTYTVDTTAWTQLDLAEAYEGQLDDWDAAIERGCLSAQSEDCDEMVVVSFERDRAVLTLDLDRWHDGRFEVSVDSRGND